MASFFKELTKEHKDFIHSQQMFFVASSADEGHINLSPKGLDTLVIGSNSIIYWLNLTGSGNETAAHVLENGRMTLMFCSFTQYPLILRVYGCAKVIHHADRNWNKLIQQFPEYLSARQIFELDITNIQTSCGYAVPFYQYQGQRNTLIKSNEKKGKQGIENYWLEKNKVSLDGSDTGISRNFE